jgi:anti-anti-sigma factor
MREVSSVADEEYARTEAHGVPVVTAPAEIDVTTAEQLRAALLEATGGTHPVVVLDMSGTSFCDSAALHVILRAAARAEDEGRDLRLVIGADGAVPRILALTGTDRRIPCFTSLEQALAASSTGSGPDPGQLQPGS